MNLQAPIETRGTEAGPKPDRHPAVATGRIGVLLINLGTPDDTSYWPMRRYLKEFLSDRRVIETNRLIWWPILNGIVLTKRPQKSGAAYRSIWNTERNESPLRTITRSQAETLQDVLRGTHPAVTVDWAMRYGNPSIASRLAALQAQGCDRILLFALYPQYSAATTATANDKAFEALMAVRWQPAIRTVPPYYDDPVYIEALAASMRRHLAALDFEPEIVLASFHGLPKEYFLKGDPYHCHCQKTARLLREALGWDEAKLQVTFQSRFGRAEWLQPYTDETVKRLAAEGVKRLAVVTPGFAADCIETLEEIAVQNAEFFHEHGGERFAAIPCLNDSPEGMRVIQAVVERELQGWV
ncbi:MAG: ferrochelatase [Pseudomonadota bacterium]|nr:ferrochelatase [Pseudomonadota bacterium]